MRINRASIHASSNRYPSLHSSCLQAKQSGSRIDSKPLSSPVDGGGHLVEGGMELTNHRPAGALAQCLKILPNSGGYHARAVPIELTWIG